MFRGGLSCSLPPGMGGLVNLAKSDPSVILRGNFLDVLQKMPPKMPIRRRFKGVF